MGVGGEELSVTPVKRDPSPLTMSPTGLLGKSARFPLSLLPGTRSAIRVRVRSGVELGKVGLGSGLALRSGFGLGDCEAGFTLDLLVDWVSDVRVRVGVRVRVRG